MPFFVQPLVQTLHFAPSGALFCLTFHYNVWYNLLSWSQTDVSLVFFQVSWSVPSNAITELFLIKKWARGDFRSFGCSVLSFETPCVTQNPQLPTQNWFRTPDLLISA